MRRWGKRDRRCRSGESDGDSGRTACRTPCADHRAEVQRGAAACSTNAITITWSSSGSMTRSEAARVTAIKAQASKLGDEANAKRAISLAMEYYHGVGREGEGRGHTGEACSSWPCRRCSPASTRRASRPKRCRSSSAIRRRCRRCSEQAEAARKAMQQQQARRMPSRRATRRAPTDLEKELGGCRFAWSAGVASGTEAQKQLFAAGNNATSEKRRRRLLTSRSARA